ncbi:MAG: hypothetical protein ACREQA_13885, partial [Candidatus Binatia bacterium]
MAIFWNSGNPTATQISRETEDASLQLGIRPHPLGVRGPNELQKAREVAARERVGALIVTEDAVLASHRTRILDLAVKH